VEGEKNPMVARIVSETLAQYREERGLSVDQAKACSAIARCRSGELGYIEGGCLCGHRERFAASCRNRHCPTCQAGAALRWVERWKAKIPGVPTYHCVFTVPESLRVLFEFGRRACFDALFAAARESIQRMSQRDPRLGGALLGMIAMLHTWGSQLQFHPHLHVILCGAGYRPDGSWAQLPAGQGWLAPVRALSRCFRRLMLQFFERLLEGEGPLFGLPRQQAASLVRRAALHRWRVFIQRSRTGPDRALDYLGRYALRVGISPKRILGYDGQSVQIAYRGRGEKFAARTCRLPAKEFLARFLQHVLPGGFRKIRAYGFLLRGGAPQGSGATPRGETKRQAPGGVGARPATLALCPRCGAPLLAFVFIPSSGRAIKRCANNASPVSCEPWNRPAIPDTT
jgi:hypothetical protein